MARQLDIWDITSPDEAAEVLLSVYKEKAGHVASERAETSDFQFWTEVRRHIDQKNLR